ncbi:hypothetical protein LNKW23_35640 [Paralimibaculum aggregatum]|uniref:Uncharacterized protein n=1 Tax=Paralimibaculum aggregatum TaxID=3036245 RepID=A0ABQ6LMC0_9RHOB|nr:hypothetical protein LNKW23_35640 [Limibaculum sp. NKW23]
MAPLRFEVTEKALPPPPGSRRCGPTGRSESPIEGGDPGIDLNVGKLAPAARLRRDDVHTNVGTDFDATAEELAIGDRCAIGKSGGGEFRRDLRLWVAAVPGRHKVADCPDGVELLEAAGQIAAPISVGRQQDGGRRGDPCAEARGGRVGRLAGTMQRQAPEYGCLVESLSGA